MPDHLVPLDALRDALLAWFHENRRDMPWRGSKDPYAVWVSEVMLQQTQVAAVAPYYRRFMAELPNLRRLADASLQVVLRLWAGLGYYSRARNLHAAARVIMADHGGRFPSDAAAVRSLPGIGEYTAGAILSIAFDRPVPAVDGNVERVLCRVCEIEGEPKKAPAKGQIRNAAGALVQCRNPGDANQALMELGAVVCTPTRPACAVCPARPMCRARAAGRQQELPQLPTRAPRTEKRTAAAIIRKDATVLLAQRPDRGVWAGLWEFPQTDVPADPPHDALAAHIHRRLGLRIRVLDPALTITHAIMNQAITLAVFECELTAGELRVSSYAQAEWTPLHASMHLPLSAPHQKILAAIRPAHHADRRPAT